ncbi:hypothetical protein [Curtobacterium sp. MCBD17_026]|uniref:hypothetical protein n=1 Tax=Curtobacterium sp. MCBD17_026 TaxID=2175621 RepID=UPI000DAA2FFA|nr:hypothetical protein [Curtobacterium sp. MCBD17_026]WIB69794.1 hypothetical protein DEI85_11535 [Curtobacterium sp. MCBD17_026]
MPNDDDDKTKQTEGATLEEKLAAAEAEAEKWKTLSRQNEQRAKDNADKAKKFDEHEEANRTELEKAQARADAAEKAIAERDAKDAAVTLRDEVAAAKGFADRKISASALRGATREELEAHADELLALVPAPAAGPSADGQGQAGQQIGDGEMSADDVVTAATTR